MQVIHLLETHDTFDIQVFDDDAFAKLPGIAMHDPKQFDISWISQGTFTLEVTDRTRKGFYKHGERDRLLIEDDTTLPVTSIAQHFSVAYDYITRGARGIMTRDRRQTIEFLKQLAELVP